MWKEKSEKHWNWELFKIAADSFFRCKGAILRPFSAFRRLSEDFLRSHLVAPASSSPTEEWACKLHRRGLGCFGVKNPLIFGAHDRVTTGHRVCGNEAGTVSLRCRTKLHLKMRCYCATQVILWICFGKLLALHVAILQMHLRVYFQWLRYILWYTWLNGE